MYCKGLVNTSQPTPLLAMAGSQYYAGKNERDLISGAARQAGPRQRANAAQRSQIARIVKRE